MIRLDSTTKSLEIDLTSAVTTNQLPVFASYSDVSQSTFGLTGLSSNDTASNDTTAVTIVSAPAASTTRKIDLITVYNADTVDAEVTIQLNNNSTLRVLVKETIKPGETLQYADGEGWRVTKKPTVNTDGRQDVVQHAHPDNAWVYFRSGDISASTDFILIDISDTTNYKHVETGYLHLDYLAVQVDSDSSGDYVIEIGFLENVDATDGDFYPVVVVEGDKQAGLAKDVSLSFYPNGPQCRSTSVASSGLSANDTAFQTDVNLASTLDPSTADTPSGSGDLALRVTVNAGAVVVGIQIGYHSHA